jgi:hypothetical protein
MLQNPNWDKPEQKTETEHPFMSIEHFIAWLEKQPGDRRYEYFSPYHCPIGKYCRANGSDYHAQYWGAEGKQKISDWNTYITCGAPWTYGAALNRAIEYKNSGGK